MVYVGREPVQISAEDHWAGLSPLPPAPLSTCDLLEGDRCFFVDGFGQVLVVRWMISRVPS